MLHERAQALVQQLARFRIAQQATQLETQEAALEVAAEAAAAEEDELRQCDAEEHAISRQYAFAYEHLAEFPAEADDGHDPEATTTVLHSGSPVAARGPGRSPSGCYV